jgi:hypothetical protein
MDMQEYLSQRAERRREILAEIGQIPMVIAGTLTEHERRRGRSTKVYHQLQRWRGGRNETRHVSAERLPQVQVGVEGYRSVQALVDELAHLDEAALFAADTDSKKKPTTR